MTHDPPPSAHRARLRRGLRRLWMKYAMRGVRSADNFDRLDLAYAMPDPWELDSPRERARFEATNALILREFGAVDTLLELGCGEGHQSAHLGQVARTVHGTDVSRRAIERARQRVPGAHFAVADIASQPWAPPDGRFDLVTACEMLYYVKDVDDTLHRMSSLGRGCLVSIYGPTAARLGPRLSRIPGSRRDWFNHGSTVWLFVWWRNDG